ncbi:TatD family hydrolase [Paenibacillus sp. SYP-B3998]|uniref:TatD family hydrolase n=1 Tax=Paenibacillus sp. SYP-B3998 TaxID=2678564 RepID=A0A6G3ZWL0_9BACL|nr:TatD family hydrolase [Paenibacillus sp. SYP-B3998]NEW06606.1 TatD family hydrolase [Paenibacillus sp. SYP-B3998]
MIKGIDAHIHLDMYDRSKAAALLSELEEYNVQAVVAVSRHLESCIVTKQLRDSAPDRVFAAYGYHPEQELPNEAQLIELMEWVSSHADEMVAIGEIGLPYYMRQEAEEKGITFDLTPYLKLLDRLLGLASSLKKPVVLHAVYEDADQVCDLLDKHGIAKAHFHWFKGSDATVKRMIRSGFYISITPDVLYEEEIQALVRSYPLERLMVETDGPWPFEGPFEGQETHPRIIHAVVQQIALLKAIKAEDAAYRLQMNTKQFYGI